MLDYLSRTPHALCKLQDKPATASLSPIPQWRETSPLPYLNAVIQEALRMHFTVGLPLERTVPEGGVMLCVHYFPMGTIGGCNPAIVHFDEGVYGCRYSVNEFWLERCSRRVRRSVSLWIDSSWHLEPERVPALGRTSACWRSARWCFCY